MYPAPRRRADSAYLFRDAPPPGWRPNPPPPPDDQSNGPHNPLSEREQWAYIIMAGMGCLTFLILLLVIIIAHSPLIAN